MCAHRASLAFAPAAATVHRGLRACSRTAASTSSRPSRAPRLPPNQPPRQAHRQHPRRAREARRHSAYAGGWRQRSSLAGCADSDAFTWRRRLRLVLAADIGSAKPRRLWFALGATGGPDLRRARRRRPASLLCRSAAFAEPRTPLPGWPPAPHDRRPRSATHVEGERREPPATVPARSPAHGLLIAAGVTCRFWLAVS